MQAATLAASNQENEMTQMTIEHLDAALKTMTRESAQKLQAESAWLNDSSILKNEGAYTAYTKGYVRAKQENEQALKVDDHQIALLVNSVIPIASVYYDHRSLRQEISSAIVPMFQQALKDARKQALVEAVAICNTTCDPYNTEHGNGYNRGAVDCEKKIKELLK